MFCTNCGATNADSAIFCSKCGSLLGQATEAPAQAPQMGYSHPTVPAGSRKNPFIAAILNILIGLGYLYLGYKKVLGTPTIFFVLVLLIVQVVLAVFTAGIGTVLVALFLAYDGYVKANGSRGYIATEPALMYRP